MVRIVIVPPSEGEVEEEKMSTPKKAFALREVARMEDWMQRLRGAGCPPSPSSSSDSSRIDRTERLYNLGLERDIPSRLLSQRTEVFGKVMTEDMQGGQTPEKSRSRSCITAVDGTRTRLQAWRADRERRSNRSPVRTNTCDVLQVGNSKEHTEAPHACPIAYQSGDPLACRHETDSAVLEQSHSCRLMEDLRPSFETRGKRSGRNLAARLRGEVLDHRRIWADVTADKVVKVETLLHSLRSEDQWRISRQTEH